MYLDELIYKKYFSTIRATCIRSPLSTPFSIAKSFLRQQSIKLEGTTLFKRRYLYTQAYMCIEYWHNVHKYLSKDAHVVYNYLYNSYVIDRLYRKKNGQCLLVAFITNTSYVKAVDLEYGSNLHFFSLRQLTLIPSKLLCQSNR